MAGYVGDNGTPNTQGKPEQFTPCERTVRMCIEALPVDGLGFHPTTMAVNDANGIARRALEALLPKPDRAEELATEWMVRSEWEDLGVRMAVVEYTRDLIERGEIKG